MLMAQVRKSCALVVLFDAGVAGLVSPFCLGFRFDPLFHYGRDKTEPVSGSL